jgi:Tetratricopeptide repeat
MPPAVDADKGGVSPRSLATTAAHLAAGSAASRIGAAYAAREDRPGRIREVKAGLSRPGCRTIPGDPFEPGSWPACAAMLPHAIAALAAGSASLERIADYLGAGGSYTAARDLQHKIADAREQFLGHEHPDTLVARIRLLNWTGEAGDAARARDQYATLIPVAERVFGAEHPVVLTSRNNHARWTGNAGNAAGARDQLAGLLPIRERVIGREHPDTLATRANLARRAGEAGDAAGARDEYVALVPCGSGFSAPSTPTR